MGGYGLRKSVVFLPVGSPTRRSPQEIARPSAFSHCLPPRFPFKVFVALWLQDTVSDWFFSQSYARYKMREAATENGSHEPREMTLVFR